MAVIPRSITSRSFLPSTPHHNKLADYLKQKIRTHSRRGDFDYVIYGKENDAYVDLKRRLHVDRLPALGKNLSGRDQSIAFWKGVEQLIKEQGLFERREDCTSKELTDLRLLWGYYKEGGLLCEVYNLDAFLKTRTVIADVVKAQVESYHAVTLVTHLTGDRITTLEKTVQHWHGK